MKTFVKILFRILLAPFLLAMVLLTGIRAALVKFYIFMKHGFSLNQAANDMAGYRIYETMIYSAVDDHKEIPHGLYKVHWKKGAGGNYSYAAIGSDHGGEKWIACTNWSCKRPDLASGSLESLKNSIASLELIVKK